jgi:uncharacterized membrane protein
MRQAALEGAADVMTEEMLTETTGRRAARLLLAAFYAIAGIGHLVFTDAMVRITPDWVPLARAVVIGTGLCELLGAAALLTRRWRVVAGWAFALYALCVFPANVNHAIIDLSAGTGLPVWYHVPRLLLQPLIIWWALWASGAMGSVRKRGDHLRG